MTTQPYITVEEGTHQKMMEPRAQRSESVYERVKKEGVCSGYVMYLIAVGVVFCSVMLGIVVWGDVIAKQNDPVVNNDTHLMTTPQGEPVKMLTDETFEGLPLTYNSDLWYQVQKVGGSFPNGIQSKHTVSGIEMNKDKKSTTIYTPHPDFFYKYSENDKATLFEYYTPAAEVDGKCMIPEKACVRISKDASERRRLQGSISGGLNNDGSGWSGNVNANQNFGGGWSGSAGGGFHSNGGWNANAGVNWSSSSGNSNFGANVSTGSGGGYQAGISFSHKW